MILGEPVMPAYAAAEAGIEALTRHVASGWGKQGIRCHAVAPGSVLSETMKRQVAQDGLDSVLTRIRSPRHGEPEYIAGLLALLLSDDGQWVYGQAWSVNGGMLFR